MLSVRGKGSRRLAPCVTRAHVYEYAYLEGLRETEESNPRGVAALDDRSVGAFTKHEQT